jgi:triosephosphate isomerase
MRPYYLAGNWKMNKTPSEALAFATELKASLAGVKHKLLVAPAFIAIPGVAEVLKGGNVSWSVRRICQMPSPARTLVK